MHFTQNQSGYFTNGPRTLMYEYIDNVLVRYKYKILYNTNVNV